MKKKKVLYPIIASEMAMRGETQKDMAELLNLSVPTISVKLAGGIRWYDSEIEKLCKHYKKDYLELFKKGE